MGFFGKIASLGKKYIKGTKDLWKKDLQQVTNTIHKFGKDPSGAIQDVVNFGTNVGKLVATRNPNNPILRFQAKEAAKSYGNAFFNTRDAINKHRKAITGKHKKISSLAKNYVNIASRVMGNNRYVGGMVNRGARYANRLIDSSDRYMSMGNRYMDQTLDRMGNYMGSNPNTYGPPLEEQVEQGFLTPYEQAQFNE